MKEYYYNLPGSDQKLGPISEEDLQAGAKDGTYPQNTLVWSPGMADWAPLHHLFPNTGMQPGPKAQCPPNHLVGAVSLLVLNFLIFFPGCILSIIAVYKASNVESLWRMGREEEAEKASRAARTLNLWSVAVLLVLCLLYIIAGALVCVFMEQALGAY